MADSLYQQRPAPIVSPAGQFAGRSASGILALGRMLLVAPPAREEERQFAAQKVVIDENAGQTTEPG